MLLGVLSCLVGAGILCTSCGCFGVLYRDV